jgi:hypothetical protein
VRRLWWATFALVLVAGQAAVGMRASTTASVTGDEPFYLLTTQSLASDRDLDLRDEYAGGEEREFWDGTIPLWKQMEPAPDGRLLSPHDPGLSLLTLPAYELGGLRGVQRFLVVLWAAAMACAAVLARRAGAPPWAALVGAVAVGAGAPGVVYASQVYPEGPAALCVALGLLLALSGRFGPDSGPNAPQSRQAARPLLLAVVLVALCWLGVKYAPLAVVIAAVWAWRFRAERRALVVAAAVAAAAGAHYVWWHLETFGGLTPYGTNVVWSGEGTASILGHHLGMGGRSYRLHGLFTDARFGLLRWLPAAGLALAATATATTTASTSVRRRVGELAPYLAVLGVCVLMGSFVSITMMGWWFPGRMLVAGLPALVVLVALGAARLPRTAVALSAWSVVIGGAVAWAGRTGRIRIAVDPFDLGFPLAPAALFPDFRSFGARTIVLAVVWLVALAAALWALHRRRPGSLPAQVPRADLDLQRMPAGDRRLPSPG